LTGRLARIIARPRATDVGFEIGFASCAHLRLPITALAAGLALWWLTVVSG
jgi:hypothetical protein